MTEDLFVAAWKKGIKIVGVDFFNRAMQLTTPTTICSIRRHECLPQKCGRTYGSFSN